MIRTLIEMPEKIALCLRNLVLHSPDVALVAHHQREARAHVLRQAHAIAAHEKEGSRVGRRRRGVPWDHLKRSTAGIMTPTTLNGELSRVAGPIAVAVRWWG